MGTETSQERILPAAVVLVNAPLCRWPASLARRLSGAEPIALEQAIDRIEGSAEESRLHLLGYTDPAEGLAAALADGSLLDIPVLLEGWRLACEAMLRLRRSHPDHCLLVNLSRLDSAGVAELQRRLPPPEAPSADDHQPTQPEAAAEPTRPSAAAEERPLPALPFVLTHYLSQRGELAQLLADLEACADLLGRQPHPPAPLAPLRGLPLAERLLEDWQAERERAGKLHEEQERLRQALENSQIERRTIRALLEDITGLQQQADREAAELRRQIQRQQEREDGERLEALRVQTDFETELSEAQKRIEAAQANLQAATAEQASLRESLEGARSELETQRAAWERLRSEMEAERQELRRQAEESARRAEQAGREAHETSARLQEAGREAQETSARLQEAEEERELILLQLKQVQDELSHLFQEHQRSHVEAERSGQRVEELEQQLAGLEEESRYLFLNSRLNADIDRSRLAGILQRMRQSLRA